MESKKKNEGLKKKPCLHVDKRKQSRKNSRAHEYLFCACAYPLKTVFIVSICISTENGFYCIDLNRIHTSPSCLRDL